MAQKITGKVELAETIAKMLHVTTVRINENKIFVTPWKGAKECFFTTVEDAVQRIEHGESGKQFSGLTL